MRPATMSTTSPQCRCRGIEPLFVSRKDAATALAIGLRSVAYLISNGELKTRKIGGRTLIAVAELYRFAGSDHRKPMTTMAV
jgi:hypothetical protein